MSGPLPGKGPPALSPGTDPPSIERVLLGRGGLPVLAFHLNQATSTNKALIINAFIQWHIVHPLPPPWLLSPKRQKTSKLDRDLWCDLSCFIHNHKLFYIKITIDKETMMYICMLSVWRFFVYVQHFWSYYDNYKSQGRAHCKTIWCLGFWLVPYRRFPVSHHSLFSLKALFKLSHHFQYGTCYFTLIWPLVWPSLLTPHRMMAAVFLSCLFTAILNRLPLGKTHVRPCSRWTSLPRPALCQSSNRT